MSNDATGNTLTIAGLDNTAPVIGGDDIDYLAQQLPALSDTGLYSIPYLAEAQDGTVYAAFSDGGLVRVARYDGNAWVPLNNGSLSSSSVLAFAVSPDGEPYAVVTLGSDADTPVVMRHTGSEWTPVGALPGDVQYGTFAPMHLGFDASGTPYLAFQDASSTVKVAAHQGQAWSLLGGGAPLNSDAPFAYDFAIAPDGTPYLAFADGSNDRQPTLWHYVNGTWNTVDMPNVDLPGVRDLRLAINPVDGSPAMVLTLDDGMIGYVMQAGGEWQSDGMDISGDGVMLKDIAFDADGNLYMALQGQEDDVMQTFILGPSFTGSVAESLDSSVLITAGGSIVVAYPGSDSGALEARVFSPAVIASATTRGTAISGLDISDADNDALTLQIVGGADADLFQIDDGKVSFKSAPAAGTYTVKLSASDGIATTTRLVSIEVEATSNQAPTLDVDASPTLPAVTAGSGVPVGAVGALVSDILAGASDADGDSLGAAITAVRGGTLYYSTNDGTTWQAATDPVDVSHALLLAPNARIYFMPAAGASGTLNDALSFKVWDGTYAESGTRFDASGHPALGQTLTVDDAGDLAAYDGYVINGGFGGLQVLDPTKPEGQQVIGSLTSIDGVTQIVVSGTTAFVLSGHSNATFAVAAVDLRDPAQPVLGATQMLNPFDITTLFDLAVSGNSVAIASDNGVFLATLGAGGTWTNAGTLSSGMFTTVALDDERIVAGNPDTGLVVYDRTDNNAATLFSLEDMPDLNGARARDIVLRGDTAIVSLEGYSGQGGGLMLLDVSDPGAPACSGLVYMPRGPEQIAVVGDLVFAVSSDGLIVVDISNVEHPYVVQTFTLNGWPSGVTAVDEHTVAISYGGYTIQLVHADVPHDSLSSQTDTVAVTITPSTPNTPDSPTTPTNPPTTPTTPIDGVPVRIGTGSDGYPVITVPVVTDDRNEDTGTAHGNLADIPLVKNASGGVLLNVGTPVGTGFTAAGPGTLIDKTEALTALIRAINGAQGSTDQRDAGSAFLGAISNDTPLLIQTITPTAQAGGNAPILISAAPAAGGFASAIVIDTSGLPSGGSIALDNVDFAAIIGAAHVTGGAGNNTVYGDSANQFIVLGEGDDVLHGGGGQDTVGSLRGNDQTFGDDGNDVVYGGTGNDVLHGGAGNDRMNGGFGLDQAVQSGVLTDYTVTVDGHTVVLTHNTTGEVDRFLDVEAITFDSGRSLIVAHEAADVATLTSQFSDAQLIELNANRAVTGSDANDEITPELGMALNIDLGSGQDIVHLAGAREDVHIDVEAGQRAELTRLADGAMLAFNNVEMLAFESGDATVLAHNHEEAVIGRAYELLLGRNVDTDGYTFWVQGIENGADLHTTLTAMMQSPEFTGASMSNADFVELLYVTGFDRAADANGKAFWVNALDNGVSRAQIVETFAASDEAVTAIGSTIDVTVVS